MTETTENFSKTTKDNLFSSVKRHSEFLEKTFTQFLNAFEAANQQDSNITGLAHALKVGFDSFQHKVTLLESCLNNDRAAYDAAMRARETYLDKYEPPN